MDAMQRLRSRYPQQRVLITGATSGLGEALALRFAAAGFRVAVASRNPAKVQATVAQIEQAGGQALGLELDVNKLEDFESARVQVQEAWDGLDILINNAGVVTGGKLKDLGLDVWKQSLDTDLWSVIHGCRVFLPLLEKSGAGHIVNVASAAGLLNGPDVATYNVAKAGVIALSETLKVELASLNIDVTVSCPTVFKSQLLNPAGHEGDKFEGTTAKGLAKEMATTSITSDHVAESLIKAMARGRLYDIPQYDGKIQWLLARLMPETFRKLILYMYRQRLWLFNDRE
jgi:NAD(P)-dependent dehydrogenase (short-subunit alcohol dehydrogenase family)